MTTTIDRFLEINRAQLEAALHEHLPVGALKGAERLNEALRYSLFPGGKRMRPLLALLGGNAAGIRGEVAIRVACGLEFIHTASLIIDDLPAMDGAAVRRGHTALHTEFGEDVAILTALSLLNAGYAVFNRCGNGERSTKLMNEVSRIIGSNGMIGGQMVDLERRRMRIGSGASVEAYEKTTALMCLTLSAAALAGGSPDEECRVLQTYGERLGFAYQLLDDAVDHAEDGFLPAPVNTDKVTAILADARSSVLSYYKNSESAVMLADFTDAMFRSMNTDTVKWGAPSTSRSHMMVP